MNEEQLKEALEDMLWQFAYRRTRGKRLVLNTGGLGALEGAFAALGWDDPHYVSIESACDIEGCYEWASTGTPWDGPYLRLCSNHYDQMRQGMARPRIREHAETRESQRCTIHRSLPPCYECEKAKL